ncbi:hypothetical protein F5B20DRAFT_591908 [Whalleya microplaca]|nr:hypothetical protein F5B20DRAFT_591908 [Whalleya microplaca]
MVKQTLTEGTGQSNQESDPPPYDCIQNNNAQQHHNPSDAPTKTSTTGPVSNGKLYPLKKNIEFTFSPDPTAHPATQEWRGLMVIECVDVPRLMREGIYWTSDNVMKEEGWLSKNATGLTWSHTRQYFLQDLQKPTRWLANLKIESSSYTALRNVRPENLTVENMDSAYAWGYSGREIYMWQSRDPSTWINVIYNDMPLERMWPWPKEEKKT